MNKTFSEADELISAIMDKVEEVTLDKNTQLIICPPFPYLEMASDYGDDSYFTVGAQDVSAQESGAYTGEVSAAMLESMDLEYCIVGHSERRAYHHETDAIVAAKVNQLLAHGIRPIVCCGEVLEEEVIPAKVAASEVTLTPSRLLIHYKETAQLSARVLPVNVDVSLVYFESSDPSVATVDTDGTVHAVGRGSAVITCRSADGQATATCPVLVNYSVRQWLIEILLFGWIWY